MAILFLQSDVHREMTWFCLVEVELFFLCVAFVDFDRFYGIGRNIVNHQLIIVAK